MPYAYIDPNDIWDLEDFSDNDLIEELQTRGYGVYSTSYKDQDINYLYSMYLTMPREFFEKELKKYFRNTLGVNEY